jgi:hypothetical protein
MQLNFLPYPLSILTVLQNSHFIKAVMLRRKVDNKFLNVRDSMEYFRINFTLRRIKKATANKCDSKEQVAVRLWNCNADH